MKKPKTPMFLLKHHTDLLKRLLADNWNICQENYVDITPRLFNSSYYQVIKKTLGQKSDLSISFMRNGKRPTKKDSFLSFFIHFFYTGLDNPIIVFSVNVNDGKQIYSKEYKLNEAKQLIKCFNAELVVNNYYKHLEPNHDHVLSLFFSNFITGHSDPEILEELKSVRKKIIQESSNDIQLIKTKFQKDLIEFQKDLSEFHDKQDRIIENLENSEPLKKEYEKMEADRKEIKDLEQKLDEVKMRLYQRSENLTEKRHQFLLENGYFDNPNEPNNIYLESEQNIEKVKNRLKEVGIPVNDINTIIEGKKNEK